MQFDSLAAFWTMEGHGPYVWSVYALALVILVSLAVAPLLRKRRFLREQSMLLRRDQLQSAGAQAAGVGQGQDKSGDDQDGSL